MIMVMLKDWKVHARLPCQPSASSEDEKQDHDGKEDEEEEADDEGEQENEGECGGGGGERREDEVSAGRRIDDAGGRRNNAEPRKDSGGRAGWILRYTLTAPGVLKTSMCKNNDCEKQFKDPLCIRKGIHPCPGHPRANLRLTPPRKPFASTPPPPHCCECRWCMYKATTHQYMSTNTL